MIQKPKLVSLGSMMVRAGLLLVCLLVNARGAVINFDDITGVPAFGNPLQVRATFVGLGIANDYAGASWPGSTPTQFWGVVNNADSTFASIGAYSGNQAAWNWGGSLIQQIVFQSPQTVLGAYFNAFASDVPWTADNVQFVAFDSNGALLATSSLLQLDKTSAHPAWQWLGFGESGVSTLEIVATQTTWTDPTQGWWAMDDLTVTPSATPIPEPAGAELIVCGLIATLVWSRGAIRKR